MFVHRNHYVPIWYQRRFLAKGRGDGKYYYLDMKPEKRSAGPSRSYTRHDVRYLGPKKCFLEKDLYTRVFRGVANDDIETQFFCKIDRDGKTAIEKFPHDMSDFGPTMHSLWGYLGSQIFRTPKGLDFLKLTT